MALKLELSKGMKLDLTKESENSLEFISVGVNWGKIKHTETITKKEGGFFGFGGKVVEAEKVIGIEDVDLDLSAIMFDKNGKHLSTVYYGRTHELGIKHSGDDRGGDDEDDGKDNETIFIELSKTQPSVSKIVFVLVSFRGHRFGALPYAGINLYDGVNEKTKTVLATTNVDLSKDISYSDKVSMVFAALSKDESGSWSYKAICEPTKFSRLKELEKVVGRY